MYFESVLRERSSVTGQQVTVLLKIITVGSAVVVKSELQKQECVVGDVSGCCRIVIWNDDNGKLLKEKSYKLSYVIVKQWDGVKYLSVSKGSEIDCVEDIGDVADVVCGDEDSIVLWKVKLMLLSSVMSMSGVLVVRVKWKVWMGLLENAKNVEF